jgi:acyl-[acyl-carrier-protein]-phospholipid O-acyltransferase / long-chain-fatty-acid--[acyl-carrier-protein] ligase
MRKWRVGILIAVCMLTSGCAVMCWPECAPRRQTAASSSLVEFLYPHGQVPAGNAIPELPVPLRVGLAFLPTRGTANTLDAAHKEQLLEQIRARFASRKFISQIVIIPDYYLAGRAGFEGLEGVQRLNGVDLMALVSYDQVTHVDDNNWSLGYLTILGAYVLHGTQHDVSTLVDLAVIDAPSRSLVLRAGGTDTRQGTSTLAQEERVSRDAGVEGFTVATAQMIDHFDSALTQFEADVRAGKANVRVVHRGREGSSGSAGGGGGALSWSWLLALLPIVAVRVQQQRSAKGQSRRAMRMPFHRALGKSVLRTLLRPLFRISVTGDAREFVNERTLIVANHESFLDGLLLAVFLPVEATFVVHSQVKSNPLFRVLLKLIPHLAVASANPLAIKLICRLVETGLPVVIFPDGRLTITGSLMKVYDGAGFVAAKTGATVVPVRIEGAGRSYFGRLAGVYPLKLLPKIRIEIQPRREIPMPRLPSAKARRRRAGELMRRILLDMLVATRPQRTLFQAFLDAKATFGPRYKLVEDVRLKEESYGSLQRMAAGLARLLKKRTEVDEVVGVLMPNAAPTLGLILALTATGRVPALLNYTAGQDGLRAACTAARIRTVVASRAFLEKARLPTLVEGLGNVEICYLEDLKPTVRLTDKLVILLYGLFPGLMTVERRPEDAAIVLFTSGSEARPKGVVHSHSSLLSNVAQVRAVADFSPLDKFMVALPIFHSFGLASGVVMPLVSGCKVFLYPSPLHYRIIPELVYDRNCTVLFGTSTFLANYGKHAHPYDFGRLRYVVAGAEKLSDEVRRLWIEKFGIRVLEGYGVTECAPVIAVNVPMACRIGAVGQFLPGMEYWLERVPGIDKGGVLHVKGPNVMKGYLLYDKPGVIEPTKSLKAGWYCTGDIVEVDEDDFVHIRGRVKRFAKIAGEMISLEVVEKIAAAAAPGFAHAASSRTDAAKGEALVLFTTAPALTRDALLAAAKTLGAPELAVPRAIQHLSEIPLLGTGKTDYVRLKQMAEGAGSPAPERAVGEANVQ